MSAVGFGDDAAQLERLGARLAIIDLVAEPVLKQLVSGTPGHAALMKEIGFVQQAADIVKRIGEKLQRFTDDQRFEQELERRIAALNI